MSQSHTWKPEHVYIYEIEIMILVLGLLSIAGVYTQPVESMPRVSNAKKPSLTKVTGICYIAASEGDVVLLTSMQPSLSAGVDQ